jgi:hypothetical protein
MRDAKEWPKRKPVLGEISQQDTSRLGRAAPRCLRSGGLTRHLVHDTARSLRSTEKSRYAKRIRYGINHIKVQAILLDPRSAFLLELLAEPSPPPCYYVKIGKKLPTTKEGHEKRSLYCPNLGSASYLERGEGKGPSSHSPPNGKAKSARDGPARRS